MQHTKASSVSKLNTCDAIVGNGANVNCGAHVGVSANVAFECMWLCREDPEAGPTVAGLSKVKVDSVDTIFALLQVCKVVSYREQVLQVYT